MLDRVVTEMGSVETGLRILRGLIDEDAVIVTVQHSIIDRLLTMLAEGTAESAAGGAKRKRRDSVFCGPLAGSDEEEDDTHYPSVIYVPPRKTGRVNKPTEKAKKCVILACRYKGVADWYFRTTKQAKPSKRSKKTIVKQEPTDEE